MVKKAATGQGVDYTYLSQLSPDSLSYKDQFEVLDKISKEIYAKYGKEINAIIITREDFKKQKDEALVKEIIKDHYVLYGVEKFVSMVFK